MKVTLRQNTCVVERENGPRIYSDSTLLYHVKRELIKQGFDVIKKRAWRDGCLVSDEQQWVRTRKFSKDDADAFAVYWGMYAIRCACEDYNTQGNVTLDVLR